MCRGETSRTPTGWGRNLFTSISRYMRPFFFFPFHDHSHSVNPSINRSDYKATGCRRGGKGDVYVYVQLLRQDRRSALLPAGPGGQTVSEGMCSPSRGPHGGRAVAGLSQRLAVVSLGGSGGWGPGCGVVLPRGPHLPVLVPPLEPGQPACGQLSSGGGPDPHGGKGSPSKQGKNIPGPP